MELKANKIHKRYGQDVVLEDISFTLEKGQKVGLVGGNGTGKSTLLKILIGEIEPEGGKVTKRSGLKIAHMPQDTSDVGDESVSEYLLRISGRSVRDASGKVDSRTEKILAGFGLAQGDSSRKMAELSAGQRSKVFMAGVLLQDAHVLLLDEPTNNLDLPALAWLEQYLSSVNAACIIVSHDRRFLDRIVDRLFEIDWHKRTLNITSGRYTDYLERKRLDFLRQKNEYEAQKDEIERLKTMARDKRAASEKGSHWEGTDNDKLLRGFKRDQAKGAGKRAKAIESRVSQIEELEKPVERKFFRISLSAQETHLAKEVSLNNVVFGYENGFRVGPVNMSLVYGSRTAIVGLNGSGKTTLLKTVSGELQPISGKVVIDSGVVFGNLTQEHDSLPREMTMKKLLMERTGVTEQETYFIAARYGFLAEEVNKEVKDFSPGGRARILFALFTTRSVNVLVLDEPTNHLDLEVMDALEEMLDNYEGTVVLVSHDRYLLERFKADDTYIVSETGIKREPDFENYVALAEDRARKMMRGVN